MELLDHDIRTFFDTVGVLVDAAAKVDLELARRIGARFNVFDVIRPDENRISDILRDLLDPQGSHGQGACFLKAFLETCGIVASRPDLASARVYRESRTSTLDADRRIDLVIDFVGARAGAIAIENKPWAGEQEMQLADYAEHLERRYEDRFHLVYLTGTGRPSTTLGTCGERLRSDGRFHTVPYNGFDEDRTLRTWIEQCIDLADAEKIRWFLRDFAAWIERSFDPSTDTESTCE